MASKKSDPSAKADTLKLPDLESLRERLLSIAGNPSITLFRMEEYFEALGGSMPGGDSHPALALLALVNAKLAASKVKVEKIEDATPKEALKETPKAEEMPSKEVKIEKAEEKSSKEDVKIEPKAEKKVWKSEPKAEKADSKKDKKN